MKVFLSNGSCLPLETSSLFLDTLVRILDTMPPAIHDKLKTFLSKSMQRFQSSQVRMVILTTKGLSDCPSSVSNLINEDESDAF